MVIAPPRAPRGSPAPAAAGRRGQICGPSLCLLVVSELRGSGHATGEGGALLAFDVLLAQPFAGLAGGQLVVLGGPCHRRHAAAEGGALLALDVLAALVLAVDAVGLRLLGERVLRAGGLRLFGRVLGPVAVLLAGRRGRCEGDRGGR